ncbi:type II toxin-antitoxin system RelE/ParE family toxin [Rugosibacter aromaticivorans]|uniref:type II toxin-antitoxin system RelE/ParE family toxin n=1 Tax=Rugosibacter aromaticivorans TaxID=1565605 RepID=UPI000A9B0DA7|nr:type II toxin-antitoxin system RelE/ParE family toxin [Rugosibacter aromaticivorans]TBR14478.1 MAG: type II toxin-antitoxin system RelE/ParE family toxin [Rugosibacter sp.]
MKIRILSLALSDLAHGKHFYERQSAGLGAYFLDSLFSDIDALLIHAGVHQQFHGYFRALSKRFPYAIYYKLEDDCADVWRVLDCRQNPVRLTQALKSGGVASAGKRAT